ncbi:MAG: sulfotransferase family protein [Pseudomonadales bacterium]
MAKPNFIIIGAARSGTTSLFKYLECHPEIYMSDIKEINYFSNEKYWNKGLPWYESHFNHQGEKLIGEASTSYTSAPILGSVPERMYKTLSAVKLIYIVRDPIDRLVSHYMHRAHRGVETRTLSDIIENHDDDPLFWQGRYYYQIQRFLEYYEKTDLHVLNVSDLGENTVSAVDEIYKFLGVSAPNSLASPKSHHNVNASVTRKNSFGKKVLEFYHSHVEQVPYPYRFKKLFLSLAEFGAEKIEKADLDENQIRKLTAFYADDVKKLEDFSGLNIKSWRNYKV